MKRVSEKRHWDEFWAGSQHLDDVYGTDDRIVEHLGRWVDLEGRKVLEVGAGTGRDAGSIAERGADGFVLDYSEESLALMRRALGRRVDIVCGDARALPFASGTFDVVYHQGLLEHFRDPEVLLDENVRVLKTGGVLLVDVPQKYHYYTVIKHTLMIFGLWFAGWETEFTVGGLKRVIESRGLEIIGFYGHNPSPPIWYRGLRRILLKTGLRLPMYPRLPRVLAGAWRLLGSAVPNNVRLNTATVIGCLARKP